MKAVILAGGLGTRLSEETNDKPKPMVNIGGMPILWHIMKIYSSYGINEFIICCGYKGYLIKEYFANYFLHTSDVTFSIKTNEVKVHKKRAEDWQVTLVDTGEKTMTGGRLKRIKSYIQNEERFCFTYGDGLSDINLNELIKFHKSQKTLATVTSVIPPGRFGVLDISKSKVKFFKEKPAGDRALINGGFFVLSPEVINYIKDDQTVWEKEPMEKLVNNQQLSAFEHKGFWQPMDTIRDKKVLENLWNSEEAPWKNWK